jgi:hypothetical protein
MAYIINKYSGEQLIVLEDGTINTSTSLGLVGRNYVGYGETQNENFVYLLENFANESAPSRPMQGQLWFDSANGVLNVYDGTSWAIVGSAALSDIPLTDPKPGALWLKTPVNTLNVWTGTEWRFIGPEAVDGFGNTRARSASVDDYLGNPKPVIIIETNDTAVAVITAEAFTINPAFSILGISNNLIAGINLADGKKINGDVTGSAASAEKLTNSRFINNVAFDGQQNITIRASTTNSLIKGDYITGSNFDGTTQQTWSVDATSSNVIGKLVARNAQGGFSAGLITASFSGNLSGNVTADSGVSTFNEVRATNFVGATLSGNAFSASQLETTRSINGVSFNGTSDITVPAAASTITGTTLNSTVTVSSLQRVGTLIDVSVADSGISIGSSGQLRLQVDSSIPTIRSQTGTLNFDMGSTGPDISFVDSATSLSLGGPSAPAIIGDNTTNLGIVGYKFNNIYANSLVGNADTSTLATTATNIVGGGLGAIPYQTAAGTTSMLGLGADNYVLRARASGPSWESLTLEQLTKGSYVNMINTSTSGSVDSFSSTVGVTISVDATSANTASKVVARDSSGNFVAGTITASLTGNVSGNATTATTLQTARSINGVSFNGSADITVTASDTTKVPLAGGTMSGYLTLVGAPTAANHAATKTYVDGRLPQYTFTYGNTVYSTTGFTNQVGSFNNGANYFDVFPPAGKTMGNLVAFVPSIAVIHYAGGVDGNDSLRCTWSQLADRVRVYVQNTEQRSTPAANYMAIWS